VSIELSSQERRIVELLLQGFKPQEIAVELQITMGMLKQHLSRLYLRAGITDGVKIVKLVVMMYYQWETEAQNLRREHACRSAIS
jgi:DNA-binding NarL/FixJ family response regulator